MRVPSATRSPGGMKPVEPAPLLHARSSHFRLSDPQARPRNVALAPSRCKGPLRNVACPCNKGLWTRTGTTIYHPSANTRIVSVHESRHPTGAMRSPIRTPRRTERSALPVRLDASAMNVLGFKRSS